MSSTAITPTVFVLLPEKGHAVLGVFPDLDAVRRWVADNHHDAGDPIEETALGDAALGWVDEIGVVVYAAHAAPAPNGRTEEGS